MDRSKIDHLSLLDVAYLFRTSKNKDYRSRTLMCAQATAEIFTEQGISIVNLVEMYLAHPESFRIKIGHLSDEGLEFSRVHYQRWLRNSDRWKGEFTLDKLKDMLLKQWQKFKKESPNKSSDPT